MANQTETQAENLPAVSEKSMDNLKTKLPVGISSWVGKSVRQNAGC